jgi:beta-glucuronidase
MLSRRTLLARSSAAAALSFGLRGTTPARSTGLCTTEEVSLCGEWLFRTDPDNAGEHANWQAGDRVAHGWRPRIIPHTWQIEPELADYRGVAWYRRIFKALPSWKGSAVRVEFEAVFHSARVWVNGKLAGEHLRKGYTAFALDITSLVQPEVDNTVTVRVDNAFDQHMLPRGRSSDWAHDGGIYRSVQLLITPQVFLERVDVDALPDFATSNAQLNMTAFLRSVQSKEFTGELRYRVVDDETGLPVLEQTVSTKPRVRAGQLEAVSFTGTLPKPRMWHFDTPHLYRLETTVSGGSGPAHRFDTIFGVRKFEVKNGAFYLNNEPVRLMGVERMSGSNPKFGMAEPEEWIEHDHADMKHLNCTFTRVHWPQDKRVLDYCDRHGILMQTEVPTWGPDTFKSMGPEPDADIMENGREQLREMIARDRNHPCIVSWGLCNEIGGQNPPAYAFAKHMLDEAKRLDPHRLCSYASHSLRTTPERDVAGLMDFIECNEYFGSWYPGGADAVSASLDQIHQAFPDKPIVISEYGYCACTADRPEGDERRREILRTHDAVFRTKNYIGGLIFFCYNDYRTHVGDRGLGVMKQRVHGVVDLYGRRKESYELLRMESSPIHSLDIEGDPRSFNIRVRTRQHVPAHKISGYKLRGIFYGYGEIPVEQRDVDVPDLTPGKDASLKIAFTERQPLRICFEILRPTGFSAYSHEWKP